MIDAAGSAGRLRRHLLWACVAVWAGAFVATHIPDESLPRLHAGDKTLHFIGFFVLGSLFLLTMTAYRAARLRRAILAVGIMALYAAFDEITQPLVGRTAAVADWLADVCGACAAVVAMECVLAVLRRQRRCGAQAPPA